MAITHYKPRIKSYQAKVELLFGGLNEEEFKLKPSKRKWSVQQCIQHLTLAGNLYAEQVTKAIVNDFQQQHYHCNYRTLQRFLIRFMKSPYHVRPIPLKSTKPASNKRTTGESQLETIQGFSALQTRLYEQVCTVHKQCKEGVVVSTPIIPLIKLNMCELFGLVCAHQQRHIWQAENIIKARRQLS